MARGYFCGGGSGGVDCDDATALEADILEGKTAGISGKDEIVSGKMPERGDWSSAELAAGESITIPGGHHSGKGMVNTKSLEKQTPGNLDANKMLLGSYGWSGGKRVDGRIYSQEGIILNPGTTAKTGMVIGKYMLGNITVPAINIPAAYIKKGQRITFPDGSSVVGTFEGWVPVATDIYYRGTIGFGGSFVRIIDQTRVDNYLKTDKIYWTASSSSINMAFATAGTVDVHKYSKIIIEGSGLSTVKISVTGGGYSESSSGRDKWYFQDATLSNSGGTFSLTAGASHQLGIYLKIPRDHPEGYITRIRLE